MGDSFCLSLAKRPDDESKKGQRRKGILEHGPISQKDKLKVLIMKNREQNRTNIIAKRRKLSSSF